MDKLQKLLDIYTSLLDSAWMGADENGLVFKYKDPAKTVKQALSINDRRVVLPTTHHLNNVSPDTKYIFHPLTESVMLGESPIVARLRLSLSVRVNAVLADLATELMALAESPAEHHKLEPKQQEVLSVLKKAKDSYNEVWAKIIVAAAEKHGPDHFLYSLFLKMRGRYKGVVYSRVGIVSFPLYEELKKNDKPYGITVSEPARKMFIEMLEFLLPGIEEPESFNYGSNSTVAPFLEALLGSIAKIGLVLNEHTELYDSYFGNKEVNLIPMEWAQYIGNLEQLNPLIRLVPAQAGSLGSEKRADELAREQSINPATQASKTTPPWEEELPQVTSKPAGVQSGGLDFAAEMRAAANRPMHHPQPQFGQPGYYGQPNHNAYQQPVVPAGPSNDFRTMMATAAAQGRIQPPPQQVAVDAYGRPIYQQPQPAGYPGGGRSGGYQNGI